MIIGLIGVQCDPKLYEWLTKSHDREATPSLEKTKRSFKNDSFVFTEAKLSTIVLYM